MYSRIFSDFLFLLLPSELGCFFDESTRSLDGGLSIFLDDDLSIAIELRRAARWPLASDQNKCGPSARSGAFLGP